MLYWMVSLTLMVTAVAANRSANPNVTSKNIFFPGPDSSMASTDGPHLFYRDGKIILKSVTLSSSTLSVSTATYDSLERSTVPIVCSFAEKPEWNFTTHIKPVLQNEPGIYPASDKILVISDIEGEFAAFRALLIANNVMTADYHWQFGTGHLVLNGDFFDRGLHVTECLWLIYHLEQEAEKVGGKVHFIIGNHEQMNMSGDLRYLRTKYLKIAEMIGEDYAQWYTPKTELGRWLATKNVIERIGPVVFVHGGISPELTKLRLSISEINQRSRPYLFTSYSTLKALGEPTHTLFSGKYSPFWYRGLVEGVASSTEVDNALQLVDGTSIIVGHTMVPHVTKLYDGRVYAIDVPHAQGITEALYYDHGSFYRVNATGAREKL